MAIPPAQPPVMPPLAFPPVNKTVPMYSPYIYLSGMNDMDGMDDMDYMDSTPSTAKPGDPPPVLSNPTPIPGTFLLKELTGYANYGYPSGNADILYTGNRGAWNFLLPYWLPSPQSLRGQLLIRTILDDHTDVPVTSYSLTITINGSVQFSGLAPMQHGSPPGGRFINWTLFTLNVPNLSRNNRVVITNTSTAGTNDWMAFDWMELRLFYL